jgi:hypothetical protein
VFSEHLRPNFTARGATPAQRIDLVGDYLVGRVQPAPPKSKART